MGTRSRFRNVNSLPTGAGAALLDVAESTTRPEPIIDLETSETLVRDLRDWATQGAFVSRDPNREYGELFPTIPTLIGALNLLPEAVEGLSARQRAKLAELFAERLHPETHDFEGGGFERLIRNSDGLNQAFGLMNIVLTNGPEVRAELQRRFEEKRISLGKAGTPQAQAEARREMEEALAAEKRAAGAHSKAVEALKFDPVVRRNHERMKPLYEAYRSRSRELEGSILSLVNGVGDYTAVESAGREWLATFESIKTEVWRKPKPVAKKKRAS